MSYRAPLSVCGIALALCGPVPAAESDALSISQNIQARHLPYGTILDPVLTPDGSQVASYTRCGDSANWTGHYLAAESFRYQVTRSADALDNVRRALAGLRFLADVTGSGLLARCAFPADSPYAQAMAGEESSHGVYTAGVDGRAWLWIGDTSRDQYAGVFFGLGVAFDMVPDDQVRADAAALASRLLAFLLDHAWTVVMPSGDISTTFLIRPDQQLALLQVGRHLNVSRFGSSYSREAAALAAGTPVPVGIDAADNRDSYFKFNLDEINLYSLLRLQGGGLTKLWYASAWDLVHGAVRGHGNAHFNMIDRALHGTDAARDAETRSLLDAWLKRPRTDVYTDLRGRFPACGSPDQACQPVPVELRPATDFLWQRSPFQLVGGGSGTIEGAGIDYILPYWMARYYGVVQ